MKLQMCTPRIRLTVCGLRNIRAHNPYKAIQPVRQIPHTTHLCATENENKREVWPTGCAIIFEVKGAGCI